MIRRFLLTGVLSAWSGVSVFAATFYISPAGSDGGIGTSGSPFKTLSHAFSMSSGGDIFILKDGTYSYPGCELNDVKSGSPIGYTVIKAENDGRAVITRSGALNFPTSNPMKQYIRIEGLTFKLAEQKEIHGNHLKFMRCGFRGGPANGNSVNTVIGGNNDATLTRHVLLEDCWFWGPGGRYKLLIFNAENIVVRRVVIRNDAGWTQAPATGNPEACFALYNSSDCEIQNLVLVDSDQTYYEYTQAFYFIHNPSANPDHVVERNRLRGIIIVNTKAVGFRADAADTTDNLLEDAIVVNSEDWGYSWGSNSDTTFTANRVAAIRKNPPITPTSGAGGYGYWGSGGGITITNSIIANFSSGPDYNGISPTYFNSYNNGSTTGGTGQKTYNPLTNGLLYPIRIEAGSSLKTAGSGGGQIGPQIVNQIGVSGTLWGEAGYNTDTGEPLWPWPHEERVVSDMCADTTRGFCGRGYLTQYIWESLGNTSPLPDPTFTPTNSGNNNNNNNNNPTNPTGSEVSPDDLKPGVSFIMPKSSTGARVTFGDEALEVLIQNDRGRTVFHQNKSGGASIVWDAKGSDGRIVESGAYLCKIRGADKVVYHLLTVVK